VVIINIRSRNIPETPLNNNNFKNNVTYTLPEYYFLSLAHSSPPPPPPLQPNVAPNLHLCPPLMDVAIATIVGRCARVDPGKGAGGRMPGHASFCVLIQVDSKQCCQSRASSNPSPNSLGDVFGVGDKRPIAVDGADINADFVMEV
jgi:hypothetical protein